MNTTDLAIVCVSSVVGLFIAACWSLAYFRGWRIIAPASNGKAAVPAVVAAPGEGKDAAAAGTVPIAGRKTEAGRAS